MITIWLFGFAAIALVPILGLTSVMDWPFGPEHLVLNGMVAGTIICAFCLGADVIRIRRRRFF